MNLKKRNGGNIPAFTLIELVVVMIISGMLISIAYFSFYIISNRFNYFSNQSSALINISTVAALLEEDFQEAETIRAEGHQLIFHKDSLELLYSFEEDYILRQQLEVVDTFKVAAEGKKYYYQGEEFMLSSGFVDQLEFVYHHKEEAFHFHFFKRYAADKLMDLNKE